MSKVVPEGWSVNALSDLAFIDRKTLSGKTDPEYSFKYIDIASVKTHKIDMPAELILFKDAPSRARKCVKKGDVLMSTVRPNLKGFAYFDKAGETFVASTGFAVITAKNKNSGKFLYYSILSDSVTRQIEALVVGSNYPAINSADVKNLEIICPSTQEQQKIATILSSVDNVIEKTRAQIDKLKDLKTGMMQELFTKGIGHIKFKSSKMGNVPLNWKILTVGDLIRTGVIAAVQDGNHGERHPKSSDYVSDGVPFIMASDLHNQEIDISRASKISKEKYRELRVGFSKPGDVLLSHKATVGLAAIVPERLNQVMLTPQVTYYRIGKHSQLLNAYLYYWFQSPAFQKEIASMSAQSTRSYIGIKAQEELAILLPNNIREQRSITEILRSVDNKIKLFCDRLEGLVKCRKSLMQDLLTGKVCMRDYALLIKNKQDGK